MRQLTLCADSFHICMFILYERVSDGIYRIKWLCNMHAWDFLYSQLRYHSNPYMMGQRHRKSAIETIYPQIFEQRLSKSRRFQRDSDSYRNHHCHGKRYKMFACIVFTMPANITICQSSFGGKMGRHLVQIQYGAHLQW